jgi:superfamily I DNA and RNA helicase
LESLLCGHIEDVEKNLQESKDQLKNYEERNHESNEVVATLRRQLEEKEEYTCAAEAIKELEKKLQEINADKKQLETVHGQSTELENGVRERLHNVFNLNLNFNFLPFRENDDR